MQSREIQNKACGYRTSPECHPVTCSEALPEAGDNEDELSSNSSSSIYINESDGEFTIEVSEPSDYDHSKFNDYDDNDDIDFDIDMDDEDDKNKIVGHKVIGRKILDRYDVDYIDILTTKAPSLSPLATSVGRSSPTPQQPANNSSPTTPSSQDGGSHDDSMDITTSRNNENYCMGLMHQHGSIQVILNQLYYCAFGYKPKVKLKHVEHANSEVSTLFLSTYHLG